MAPNDSWRAPLVPARRRESGLRRLCQPHRRGGRPRLHRPELHRRTRWRRPGARRPRGGAIWLADLDPEAITRAAGVRYLGERRQSSTARSPAANPPARRKARHDQDPQPAARRQRDAALRRARHHDAPARAGHGGGPGRLLRRRAARHRHLEPRGTRFGPRQIRAESALLRPYNMATRAAPFDSLQVADIGDVAINHLRPQEDGRDHRAAYDASSPRLPPADARRRSHHRAADPARDEEETRPGRPGPCRRRMPTSTRRCSASRSPTARRSAARSRRASWTPAAWSRSACAGPAMPPTISTGRAGRASASSRPRNAGTSRSPR